MRSDTGTDFSMSTFLGIRLVFINFVVISSNYDSRRLEKTFNELKNENKNCFNTMYYVLTSKTNPLQNNCIGLIGNANHGKMELKFFNTHDQSSNTKIRDEYQIKFESAPSSHKTRKYRITALQK